MPPHKAFGDRLAQERREKGCRERTDVLQKHVAKAIKTSATNVSRWEAGEVMPGKKFLARLAHYFGVTVSWLHYGEGERTPPAPFRIREEIPEGKPGRSDQASGE